MTLQQLTYFVAVAERGSFSAAADALHLARPSVSQQIARLEAELGVALFIRAGRRLELTDAGRALAPEAARTLAAAREAADVVRDSRSLDGGAVSFGTFSTAHHFLLTDVIHRFTQQHPHVSIRVVGQNSSHVADAVRAGQLEAGLVALPIDESQLDVSAPVAAVEVVYASADARRAARPVSIEALAETRLVMAEARWGINDPTRRQLQERAQRAGVELQPFIEVEFVPAALELAARGAGDTITMRTIIDRVGLGDQLHQASLDPPLFDTYAFVSRHNVRLSPATRAFLTLLEAHVASLTG